MEGKTSKKWNKKTEANAPMPCLGKNDKHRANATNTINRPVFWKGTTSTSLVVVPRNIWIFISMLDSSVTQEAVGDFVGGLCEGDKVASEKLQTRFETHTSFKVGIPIQYCNIPKHLIFVLRESE